VALSTRVHPGVALRAVQGRLRVDPSVLRLDSIRQGPAWTFAFSAQAEPDGTVTLSASAGQATSGAAPVEVATLHYTIVGGNGTGSTTQTANVVLLDGSLRPVGLAGLGITEATFAVGAPNQLPVARANGPYAGFLGAGISFSAAGSYDPDGQITAFEWTFGDGAAATGAAPRHFYRTVGTYTAVLTTRDNRGAVARDSAQVTVVEPSSFAWKAAWSRGTAGPAPAGGPLAAPLQTRPDSAGPGDAVSLRLTSRPGIAYQAISARVEWDPDVVRFDSVSAGSLATGTFQGTLATDSSLDIYARASNPQAGTSEAHVATAYFTVNAVEGSSTITSSSAVQLFDGAGGPLDVTNLPILESTLLVAECCDPTVLPVARAGGPYSGAVGAPLTLSGAASTGAISTYAWDFGDGDTGTGVSPTHTYAAAGTFQVVLTVSGAGGTDSDTTTVTVGLVPVANAGGPYIGTAGPAVSLDGTGSTGTITSYSWTLGDGTSSTLPDPSHRYACPSTYQAVLTVSGPGGTSSDTTSVTIAGALSGANILGCWTDASGVPIVRATPGQSVILEVCTPVADTEAIQGRIGHDDLLVSRSSMADLDASSARTPVCMGADDRLSQFTGSTSPSENPGQFQTFSLSGAGSGPQGVVKITYVVAAGASGTLIPSWFLQLWSTSTSAAPSQILADIPALEIAP
jgi:PKD repeat protein